MHCGGKLAGPAFTVKVAPGDNLLVHKAIDTAAPGDVIVVDAGGHLEQAIIGEIMSSWAAKRGVAGFVIDGAVRDAGALAEGSFPVYARARRTAARTRTVRARSTSPSRSRGWWCTRATS